MIFKKKPNNTNLLIIISLSVFFVFFVLLTTFKTFFSLKNSHGDSSLEGKFYLNDNFENKDPFITKIPQLEDMLAGPIISKNDPQKGNPDAKVSIVVFSDFKCKHGFEQEQRFDQIFKKFEGKLNFVWKDYPSGNSTDSPAWKAAIAARCAHIQDKFWPFHELLFQNQDKLEENTFLDLAENFDLDMKKFKKCLENKETFSLIKDNIEEANALGITGVPFMYVNNQEIMGEIELEDLEKIIELELKDN